MPSSEDSKNVRTLALTKGKEYALAAFRRYKKLNIWSKVSTSSLLRNVPWNRLVRPLSFSSGAPFACTSPLVPPSSSLVPLASARPSTTSHRGSAITSMAGSFFSLRSVCHLLVAIPALLTRRILPVLVSIPPMIGHTTTITLTGYAYGMKGFPIAAGGTLFGATFAFAALRFLFGERLRKWSRSNDKWQALETVLVRPVVVLQTQMRSEDVCRGTRGSRSSSSSVRLPCHHGYTRTRSLRCVYHSSRSHSLIDLTLGNRSPSRASPSGNSSSRRSLFSPRWRYLCSLGPGLRRCRMASRGHTWTPVRTQRTVDLHDTDGPPMKRPISSTSAYPWVASWLPQARAGRSLTSEVSSPMLMPYRIIYRAMRTEILHLQGVPPEVDELAAEALEEAEEGAPLLGPHRASRERYDGSSA